MPKESLLTQTTDVSLFKSGKVVWHGLRIECAKYAFGFDAATWHNQCMQCLKLRNCWMLQNCWKWEPDSEFLTCTSREASPHQNLSRVLLNIFWTYNPYWREKLFDKQKWIIEDQKLFNLYLIILNNYVRRVEN